jgi:hypothetical protein
MKRIVRLTESDLTRIVKRVIKENNRNNNSFEPDVFYFGLRKLARELQNAGYNAKHTGINMDFITVVIPKQEDLQITLNDEGQFVVQPRSAKHRDDKVLYKSIKTYKGEFADNLESGIKDIISYFNFESKKDDWKLKPGPRPFHKY